MRQRYVKQPFGYVGVRPGVSSKKMTVRFHYQESTGLIAIPKVQGAEPNR
jgi:hypothetical protein